MYGPRDEAEWSVYVDVHYISLQVPIQNKPVDVSLLYFASFSPWYNHERGHAGAPGISNRGVIIAMPIGS